MTRPARSALDTAVQMAGALPGDGWLQRIAEGQPFGPIEALLAAVRGTVYARATAQDAGYGLETEMAEPDPALVEAAAPAVEALELLLRPLVALGKRLEAVIEDAPDWLDAQARARVEGAIGGLAWRVQTAPGLDRARPRGSAARPIPISSTGSRSSGSRAANMISACTATGSIRPGRSPRSC